MRFLLPAAPLGSWLCVVMLASLGCGASQPAKSPGGSSGHGRPAKAPPIAGVTRGINLGNALDAPREGEWGVTLEAKHFEMVAAAGFDHVRLPVRFDAHADDDPPYTIDPKFLARVDWAIDQALSRKLSIIVDIHHYEELSKDPEQEEKKFVGLWKQIAAHFKSRPKEVLYELLNEPSESLTADTWNEIFPKALAEVRAIDKDRRVIIDSAFWASPGELRLTLEVPSDPNLIGSFHMYQPILFTHQGASGWMPPEYATTGIVFPGPPREPVTPDPAALKVGWVKKWFEDYNTKPADTNPCSRKTIAQHLDWAMDFVGRTGLPIYNGEFGAIDKADEASRVAYLRMVREESEARGIPWAYWDDGGTFKILDVKAGTWLVPLRDALLK